MFAEDRKVRFVASNQLLVLVDSSAHSEDWLVLDVTIPSAYPQQRPIVVVSHGSVAGACPADTQHGFAAHTGDEDEPRPLLFEIYEAARDWMERLRENGTGTCLKTAA